MYHPPYIGITGFAIPGEVESVLSELPANLPRKLMVGVLANRDTLAGKDGPRQFAGRYPKVKKIAEIFNDDPRAMNLIHYTSQSQGLTLANEMVEIRTDFGGPLCHGIQMNLIWPSPRHVVEHYRRLVEHSISAAISPRPTNEVIVLQVGRQALEACDFNPLAVAARLREYDGLINYALIDQSGGKGVALSPQMAELAQVVASLLPPSIGIGVAGGLSAITVDRHLQHFTQNERQKFSIDAEWSLRSPSDTLIIERAVAYVRRSLYVLHTSAMAE